TSGLRSAKVAGSVSSSPSNTLITPLFSATKTRPSLANRSVVGLSRPLMATVSWKPEGTVVVAPVVGPTPKTHAEAAPRTARVRRNNMAPRPRITLLLVGILALRHNRQTASHRAAPLRGRGRG